ncbi:hypothetical protein [Dictyobacter halimunensis]
MPERVKEEATMARNDEKYFYLNSVGIEKDSWTLERFLQDAKEHCMLDLLPKFLIQRLTDYYQLMDRLALKTEPSAGAAAATVSQPEASSDAPAMDQPTLVGARRGKKKGGTSQNQVPAASESATVDDSADYWGTL